MKPLAAVRARAPQNTREKIDDNTPRAAEVSKATERTKFLFGALMVMLVGLSVRWVAISTSNFPINDGGMFYQAIVQIKAAHFHLPAELKYNGLSLPFAYSPLGFYVAGLISSATGASVIQLLRVLPVVFSLATIVAFMIFANEFLEDRTTTLVASLAFALVPRSYNWEIMGGGLTRGLAYFFAILTLWQVYRMYMRHSRLSVALAAVFGALTCLSHIEFAWFVAFSAVLFFIVFGRSRRGLINSFLVGLGVLLLSSPWWFTVISRDGLAPFQSAGQSGAGAIENILGLLVVFNLGDEPRFPLFAGLAILGIIVCLRRGQTFLPMWLLVILIFDTRKSQTDAMVPLSMVVGIALVQFLIPFMSEVGSRWFNGDEASGNASTRVVRWLSPITIAILLGYGWISSLGANIGSYTSLSQPERAAMAWVQTSTPENAKFAVVTGDIWALDRSSEWFPVLADRVSIATVQGYEWAPNHGFAKQQDSYDALQNCSTETPTCVEAWAQTNRSAFDYLYVGRRDEQQGFVDYHAPCCSGLVALLKLDPSYRLVFENEDAFIFEHTVSTARSQ